MSHRNSLGAAASIALALALVACSDREPKEAKKDGLTLSAAPEAGAETKSKPAAPSARKRERTVRTRGTIESLTESEIGFRLADGTHLTAERAILDFATGRDERREARRQRDAKTGSAEPGLPLAVGQEHPLALRYDADGKLTSVRVRRTDTTDAANGKR